MIDGDGRLEVVSGQKRTIQNVVGYSLYLFQRAADGSLVETQENPLRSFQIIISLYTHLMFRQEVRVTDWNSDGLPDDIEQHLETGPCIMHMNSMFWIKTCGSIRMPTTTLK